MRSTVALLARLDRIQRKIGDQIEGVSQGLYAELEPQFEKVRAGIRDLDARAKPMRQVRHRPTHTAKLPSKPPAP